MNMDEFFNTKPLGEDYELADAAMRNTYKFIISGCNWDKLPHSFWMLDDPEGDKAIKELMDYFITTEEYEKCAKLKKILETKEDIK